METTFQKVTDFLDSCGVNYQILEHAAVFTSEQAAQIRGTSLKQGAKALLFKTKENFILAVLPGDRKIDSKKLKHILGVNKLRFATPEEVKETMDCDIGSCYPFGNLAGVKMIVDTHLADNESISFNAGLHTKSVLISYRDYEKAVKPEIADIAKEAEVS